MHIFKKAAEITIAREQDRMVDMWREAQHIECNFHIHIPFDTALAGFGVGEFARQLADHRIAIIVQPVDQRP